MGDLTDDTCPQCDDAGDPLCCLMCGRLADEDDATPAEETGTMSTETTERPCFLPIIGSTDYANLLLMAERGDEEAAILALDDALARCGFSPYPSAQDRDDLRRASDAFRSVVTARYAGDPRAAARCLLGGSGR